MTRLWSLLVKLWRSLVGAAGELGAAEYADLTPEERAPVIRAREARLDREALASVRLAIERGEDVDDDTRMRAERAARRQREAEAASDHAAAKEASGG